MDDPNVCIIAWTTTPWTLPSNLSVCVNPELDYVKVKGKKRKKDLIFETYQIILFFTGKNIFKLLTWYMITIITLSYLHMVRFMH